MPTTIGPTAPHLADRGNALVVERIVDATYRVIERSGDVDPTIRDILREAGLSTPAFYRNFSSKDELFVALLADGRRRLAGTIERRCAPATTGAERVEAWVAAVLDQARDPAAAARTRPFMAHLSRLDERFPHEHRAAEQLLIDQLVTLIERSDDLVPADPRADATAVYHLVFAALGWHLRRRTAPTDADVGHLVDFVMRAVGGAGHTARDAEEVGDGRT